MTDIEVRVMKAEQIHITEAIKEKESKRNEFVLTKTNKTVKYFVNKFPSTCFDCACSRTWQKQNKKVVKCQISGKFDLAIEQGGSSPREDCPLILIKK